MKKFAIKHRLAIALCALMTCISVQASDTQKMTPAQARQNLDRYLCPLNPDLLPLITNTPSPKSGAIATLQETKPTVPASCISMRQEWFAKLEIPNSPQWQPPQWQPYLSAWVIMELARREIYQRRCLYPSHRDIPIQIEVSNQEELSLIPIPLRRCQSMIELGNLQDGDPRLPGGVLKLDLPRRASQDALMLWELDRIQIHESHKKTLSSAFFAVMASQHKLAGIVKAKGYPDCMHPIHDDVIEPVQQALEAIDASKMLEKHYPE